MTNTIDKLLQLAHDADLSLLSREFAFYLDSKDELRWLRRQFHIPKMGSLPTVDHSLVVSEEDCIYLCGNSLGLQPKTVEPLINAELHKWAEMAVYGHEFGQYPWKHVDEQCEESMAKIVGTKPNEISLLNTLTTNIHLLLTSFYQPSEERYKILLEDKAFPSDHYAIESQIRLHGLDPESAMICLKPRPHCLRNEDILNTIDQHGTEIALIFFSGVQYYTGQLFDMPTVTRKGQQKGCIVGWDLAHAAGNVPMMLHDWGIDFAVWCTYKYLNSGAGGIGGLFLHEKHHASKRHMLLGWWGHKFETRFEMDNGINFRLYYAILVMDQYLGPRAYRLSNPSMFTATALRASLDVFDQTSMEQLRQKSLLLTRYLEYLVQYYFGKVSPHRQQDAWCDIITPDDPSQRGCQLSLVFSINIQIVHENLMKRGVACDVRLPSVIRIAPVHLYNSFYDVYRFIDVLKEALKLSEIL